MSLKPLSGHSWALEAISKNSPNAELFPHVTGHVQLDCNGNVHFFTLHAWARSHWAESASSSASNVQARWLWLLLLLSLLPFFFFSLPSLCLSPPPWYDVNAKWRTCFAGRVLTTDEYVFIQHVSLSLLFHKNYTYIHTRTYHTRPDHTIPYHNAYIVTSLHRYIVS